jgi:acetyl esterase/lipase
MAWSLASVARLAIIVLGLAPWLALADDTGIEIRRDVAYGQAGATPLLGDLYLPRPAGKAPVIVAVHGGAWQSGSRAFYQYWGPFLAKRGYAVFAIDYRLSQPGLKTFPEAVSDVRAAIRYLKADANGLGVDGSRLALMGDSAGAQLSALVALTDRVPGETADEAGDGGVKAAILFYGVYDMAAQWHHDQLARPNDQITQKFIGASPIQDRRAYFDASPISYPQQDGRGVSFFLTWGTTDTTVDPHSQSEAFAAALSEAGKYVRTVVVPFAPHFWSIDPIEEEGSYTGVVAPRLLRFLQDRL